MGTKNNPGKFDCYANALPDEPMFILLARDPMFKELIDIWADRRSMRVSCGDAPESDSDLVLEASMTAEEGAQWRRINNGKWRGQDEPQTEHSGFCQFTGERCPKNCSVNFQPCANARLQPPKVTTPTEQVFIKPQQIWTRIDTGKLVRIIKVQVNDYHPATVIYRWINTAFISGCLYDQFTKEFQFVNNIDCDE